jgi:phosphoglucomutase
VHAKELGGEPVQRVLSTAPGNGAPIGGVKVVAEHSWFAARPSGTENVNKVYAESFRGPDHLRRIQEDADAILREAFATAGR